MDLPPAPVSSAGEPQPGAVASEPATVGAFTPPGTRIPLHALKGRCADPRLPGLAGPFAVGCGAGGDVDRVIDLRTGAEHRISPPLTDPALADGFLYQPGMDTRLIRLDGSGPVEEEGVTRLLEPPVSPPATDGAHIAVLSAQHLQVVEIDRRGRRQHETRPAEWYGVALAWPWVAWVEDAGPDGEDVVALNLEAHPRRVHRLSGGPGDQRHVVGQGGQLAWVEPGALVLHEPQTGERVRIDVETGFSAPPSLHAGVLCWEERAGTDGVDVRCSDGLAATGPGHQRWPHRYGPWLLYREGDTAFVVTPGARP